MSSPRRSSRIALRDIDACFGSFDGDRYDVSGLSPVQALGKLSAVAMLVTDRVGDPQEDVTMSQAKPILSKINKEGLVTTDSQMGRNGIISNAPDATRNI